MSPIRTCLSGDNIRYVGVDDLLDAILQHQLAAFKPSDLQLVATRFRRERLDTLVEFPVLGLQCFQVRIIVGHPGLDLDQLCCRRKGMPFTTGRAQRPINREMGQDKARES